MATGCEPQGITSDWRRIDPPVAAPDFTLPQLDGAPVRLADLKGRVVIMEFWATWCGPCRYTAPSLEVIYRRYRDRGVTVLLINEEESAAAVRRWAGRRFTAPILLDEDGQVGAQYEVSAIPRLLIVDQAGRIVYDHQGYGGGLEQHLKRIVDELLAAPPAATHV